MQVRYLNNSTQGTLLTIIGIHTCVGKNLGLMEMRFAAAVMFSKYDIAFAPGEDNSDVEGKQTDTFTVEPGNLRIVLTER